MPKNSLIMVSFDNQENSLALKSPISLPEFGEYKKVLLINNYILKCDFYILGVFI
jgi:hypothetical protein